MAFEDIDAVLTKQPKRLPLHGKTYEFPGDIPWRAGLTLQRLAAAAQEAKGSDADAAKLAAEVLTERQEDDLMDVLLGPAQQQMADDGVTTAEVAHVFRTLMVWHIAGQESAEEAWRKMGEAPAPSREQRRAASKGSGSTTRSPASTSGITTQPRKRVAAASHGRRSSNAGTS